MSMTVDHVAGVLGVSRWTVSRACQSGAIQGASRDPVTREWAIPASGLSAFIAAKTTGGPDSEDPAVELDELHYYTLDEVAERTSIPVRWLAHNCRTGAIRACKIGRSWRMTATQIRAISMHAEKVTAEDSELAAEREYRDARRGRRRSTTAKAA